MSGSENASTWPEAFQTVGCIRMAASRPTTFSWSRTIAFHHRSRTFRFNSTPSGP